MKTNRKLIIVAAMLLSTAMQAQVCLDVDINQKGIELSPSLYGIFYEDINFASDGGLYAELIRNRSFEYDQNQPAHWKAINSQISLTTEGMLNPKQQHALRMQVTEPEGGVSNPGYWGINAVRGTQYRLSFWTRMEKGTPGNITASLFSQDGKEIGRTQITTKVGRKWQKVEALITATDNDPKAEFRLQTARPCTMLLDVVSLFPPTFRGRENGCRPDLAEKLQALHPAFMRFPGGCYVEGNIRPENAYHWERTVGPIEQRPGHMNANWGYPTTDGLGFHEFLQLAEDLGAKPLYVVNIGIWHGGCTPLDSLQPWIDECLGALEYANGPITSHYGKMRAENGHPEPFGIAYIEIGNENYNWHMEDNSDQSDHYPERYRMFYDAIKARFPEVQCIGNVESWGTDTPRWRNSHPVDILDEHYYRTPQWFVSQYHRFDNYDRRGPVIYPGEYAVTSGYGNTGNMNAALGEAVFMLGMENNADIVRMSSYAPIFVNENAIQWRPDMIRFNSSQSFGTPSYWVQQLFPSHVGNRVVKCDLQWQLPDEVKSLQQLRPVTVGVGTWKTQASFRNAEVIIDGTAYPLSGVDSWQTGMPDQKGNWSMAENGTLQQQSMDEGTFHVCPASFQANRYTYRVQAKKDGGNEGFLIVFGYQDSRNYSMFNVGGWGNTRTTVETARNGGKSSLEGGASYGVENGRWYDIQIDVDGDNMVCRVDGEVKFSGRAQDASMRGVYANTTMDEANGVLYTKVINLGTTGSIGTISLNGGKALKADMVRLCAMTGEDENTMQFPNNIVPRPAEVRISEDAQHLNFQVAPHSVNIITIKTKNP